MTETNTNEEKAQLHSDEYRPPREELQGSTVPRKIRAIDGLHEVEYRDIRAGKGEMEANEPAALEMNAAQHGSSNLDYSGTTAGSHVQSDQRLWKK